MESYAVLYLLAFCRVWGFMQMLPQLGELDMPSGMRLLIYASITPFMVAPYMVQDIHLEANMILIILIAKEVILGLFVGFLASLPLRLPEMIGDFIDNQRGTAVNSQFNPALGEESSSLGTLLFITVLTYFYTEGGFESLINLLSGTFALQPIHSFEFTLGEDPYHLALGMTTSFLKIFAILSFPIVAVLLLVDIAFGTTSKFAQSLNVFSLAQPVKATIAIAMLVSIHPRITKACIEFFNQIGGALS